MNFKQLETLYWLNRLGSFQKVAEQLMVTQPAISLRVSGLEDQVGAKLLLREGNNFTLTEQGISVVKYAERFLDLREEMTATIKIGTSERFAIGIVGLSLANWVEALRDELDATPDGAMVDFHFGSNKQLHAQAQSGTLDMVFLTDAQGMGDVGKGFVVSYEVGWVSHPTLVDPAVDVYSTEMLRKMPLVLYPRSGPFHSPVADYIDSTRHSSAPRHYANSMPTMVDMLRRRYGASAIALTVVENELASGDLIRLETEAPHAPMEMRCYHLNSAKKMFGQRVLNCAHKAASTWCANHSAYMRFG